MTVEQFAKAAAVNHIEIQNNIIEKRPGIVKRTKELWNNPSKRNPMVWDYFLKGGLEAENNLGGLPDEIALSVWRQIESYANEPLDVLASVPASQRSYTISTAMAIILAASQFQAELKAGIVQDSMALGVKIGNENDELMRGVNTNNASRVVADIRGEMKKIDKESGEEGDKK